MTALPVSPAAPAHRRRRRFPTLLPALLVVAVTAAATILGTPAAARADSYPSWDDVQAARASESAKQAEITTITNIIADLQAKADAARQLVDQRTSENDAAEAALAAGQAKSDALAASSAAAATTAEASKKRAAVVASQFAHTGGNDLTSLLLTSSSTQADDLLSQLSSAGQLAQAVNAIYASAEQDANTSTSLAEQAAVAKDQLSTLADAAQQALVEAAAAQQAMVAALQEQSAHQAELDAQLVSLQQNVATTEQQYQAAAAAHSGGNVVGPVSGDAQALAEELMGYVASGQFHGSSPDHIFEIAWIAQGKSVENCGIDVTILQAMVAAVRAFGSAGVSDISRRCTGQIEGAGTASAHYKQGGGHAVDFTSVGGVPTTGANNASLNLIQVLDPIMPNGSRVGQQNCRLSAGNEPRYINFIGFADTCNHLHVDDF